MIRQLIHRTALLVATAALVLVAGCTSGPAGLGSPAASAAPSVGPSVAGGPPRLTGTVTAGPVCPVEKNPPDPACAPRPVASAVIIATNASGEEVGRTTTAADGTYTLVVGQTGAITVTAQPVKGYMGTPAPATVTFAGPSEVKTLDLAYDTGIR
jgi:hypothetical protein